MVVNAAYESAKVRQGVIESIRIKRRNTVRASYALFLVCGILMNAAGAQDRARIFYHEPIEEIAHEGGVGVAPDFQELLIFQAFGRRFELRLRANEGLLRFGHKNRAEILRGDVSGDVKSWVRLTRNGRELSGLIREAGDVYVIEPRRRVKTALLDPAASDAATNVIYRIADSEIPLDDLLCATEAADATGQATFDALMAEISETPVLAARLATERVSLGILADHDLHQLLEPNTEAEILDRMNIVDGIFSEALGIEISIDTITVFPNENTDPISSSRVAKTLLESVHEYRTANQLDLGLTHLVTGRDLTGKTAGLAYVGQAGISGVCTDTGAALTERGSSVFISALLIAHEIGHNMGAGHDGENKSSCESVPETYLMAPVINGNDEFSACSIQAMEAVTRSASCIDVIPDVDLILSLPAGGLDIAAPLGGTFELSFEVANIGSDTAKNVRAELDMPVFLSLVDLTVDGGRCTVDTATCVIDGLAAGATSTISATLRADAAGSYTVSVDVSSPDDRDVTTNSGTASVTVEATPDLRTSISGEPSMEAGKTEQASISVENNSAVVATDVTVTISATNGLDFEILSVSDGSCAATTCSVATLPDNATLQIVLDVTGDREGAMKITVNSRANEGDAAPGDNTASQSINIVTPVTAPTSTGNGSNAGGGGGGGAVRWTTVLALALVIFARRKSFRTGRLSPSSVEMRKSPRLRPR